MEGLQRLRTIRIFFERVCGAGFAGEMRAGGGGEEGGVVVVEEEVEF